MYQVRRFLTEKQRLNVKGMKYKARKKAKLEKQQLAHVSGINVDNDNGTYLLF